MQIIDLDEQHKDLFCCCLEDWSHEPKEAGCKRLQWVESYQQKGLRAKLAQDDAGQVGGMIQYLPIEHAIVLGEGLYFIPCVWVHGYKQGRGNFQKHGMGTALLEAAEEDARARGAKGMAAWGLWLPFWMKASWFKKHGYKKADRQGMAQLMWKPFSDDAQPPRWFDRKATLPSLVPGKVTVTAFSSGWCMAQNLTFERARRAAAELGDDVIFHEIDTSGPNGVARWGISDEVFVDNRTVQKGPPPSYDQIVKKIRKRMKKL